MFNFLSLTPQVFGIDFSDLSIKVANMKRNGDSLELVSVGETPVKEGVIRKGEIRQGKELAEIVREAVRKVEGRKIRKKFVIASLPEEKAFVRIIKMPFLANEDLKSAVIYEAENYIPLPIEDVYLGHYPLFKEKKDEKISVLIAAMPKKIVDPYIECIKASGYSPLALEIESMAITRALIDHKHPPKDPVLIIDLGATRTSFIVFSRECICFTSSIPVSSQGFTEIIARNLDITAIKAEKLKMKYGLEDQTTKQGSQIFDALVPPLTDLADQIQRCLQYFKDHVAGKELVATGDIKKIVFCGGGANLKGLLDFLSRELKLPVEVGNPFINISGIEKRIKLNSEQVLSYTTAVGLSLRGQGYD